MKRVYISLPMNGKTWEELKAEREKLKEKAKRLMPDENLEFIDSIVTDAPPENVINKSLWSLGQSIQIMATADVVIFADGWENHRGCRVEYDRAWNYGLDVLDVR